MIFKQLHQLFTRSKWQHQDEPVRLKALQQMDPDDPEQRPLIEQLAFTDSSDNIRKLALEQLNCFASWLQASRDEKSERLKKQAEEHIRLALVDQADFSLDPQTKAEFIEQCNKTQWLEALALNDPDEKLRLKLLDRMDKDSLWLQTLKDPHASVWLKDQCIERFDSLPSLEKLLKRADDSIKALLTAKVASLKQAIEKPKLLQQDVTLVLAKLNALKDKTDIVEIEQKKAQLQQQWQDLSEQFDCLSEEQSALFNAKYQKITTSVENIIAPLRQKWQQQQQLQQLRQTQQNNQQLLAERLSAIEAMLANQIGQQQNDSQPKEALQQLQTDMQQMELAAADEAGFMTRIEQIYQQIDHIPLIIDCIEQARQLLLLLETLAIPEDIHQLTEVLPSYKAWQQSWIENQKRMGLAWPQDISEQYQQLTVQFDDAVKPLLKEQDQYFSEARKALTDLRYLLSSGKYRRAFGLFKKVGFLMEQLNPWQLDKLSRDFDSVKGKIEELTDWQEYIAIPRKQQLLDDIQELAFNPVDSPAEQAQKVKFTRQMWNSLGRGETDADHALNQQFDEACEKAFTVCREFYAGQEAARARHLEAKQDICQQLEQTQELLSEEPVPWKKIEQSLNSARTAFEQAGDVDRNKVHEINKRFYAVLKPMQKVLHGYYDDNAQLKQKLVEQAEALVAIEDVFDAANQLKGLQQQWKTIGFAGGKNDTALWRKFRKFNDQIFVRRDAVKNQRKNEHNTQLAELNARLEEIEQQVLNGNDQAVMNKSLSALDELSRAVATLPKSLQGKIASACEQLGESIKRRKAALKLAEKRQQYLCLFDQFEQVSRHGELAPEIASSAAWNALLSTLPTNADQSLRYDLTIQLEIVAGVESPVRDTDRRMSLQMGLLSDKMNQGSLARQDELLKAWIALGRLHPDDGPLLDRVKALYL